MTDSEGGETGERAVPKAEKQRGNSCIDCAANPRVPLGLSLSTSVLPFKEETLTAVSSRALNPALIDIEFSDALMPAVFIPAALAIELCPPPSVSPPDMFITFVMQAADIFFFRLSEWRKRQDVIWCCLQVLEGVL